MEKKCNFCGNKNFSAKRVRYIFKSGGKFLVVNDVPCEEISVPVEEFANI